MNAEVEFNNANIGVCSQLAQLIVGQKLPVDRRRRYLVPESCYPPALFTELLQTSRFFSVCSNVRKKFIVVISAKLLKTLLVHFAIFLSNHSSISLLFSETHAARPSAGTDNSLSLILLSFVLNSIHTT